MSSYNQTIRVAVADDHALFREGIKMIVESRENLRCVIEADNGQALLDAIAKAAKEPDVVLLDLKMPVMDGMECTKRLREEYPRIKILILTMLDQDDYILHLLDLGANGYLLKNSSADEVQRAIETVMERDFYFSEHVSKVMLSGLQRKRKSVPVLNATASITEREQEVLRMMCDEHTTAEIAERLFLSVRTVETHRKHLMEKLGAKNTAGIIYRALKEGVLE